MDFYLVPESQTTLLILFRTCNGLNDDATINEKIYTSLSVIHLDRIKNWKFNKVKQCTF